VRLLRRPTISHDSKLCPTQVAQQLLAQVSQSYSAAANTSTTNTTAVARSNVLPRLKLELSDLWTFQLRNVCLCSVCAHGAVRGHCIANSIANVNGHAL
jgi:hypothetical protein